MEEALSFPLLLTAEQGSGNSGMGEGVSRRGGFGEAERRDPCSARTVGQGKPMFGADLSTAVRVKISTDVQAAGLRVDQKQVSVGCTSFSTNQLTVKTHVKIIHLISKLLYN